MLEKIEDYLVYLYYYLASPIEIYRDRLKRFFAYGRMGWDNYDFDGIFLYGVMSFKLKRVYETLVRDEHAIYVDNDLISLLEAIAICERLFEEKYDEPLIKEVDENWGEPKFDFVRDDSGAETIYTMRTSVKNVKTEEDEQARRLDVLNAYDKAEELRKADIDRLAAILKGNSRAWWS